MNIKQTDLDGFYGTGQWYKFSFGLLLTDGTHYLCQNGAGWLMDAIAFYQYKLRHLPRLRDFQLWELTLNKTGSGAVLTCREDSDQKPVVRQRIAFTDFPFNIKIYVEGNVILLPSEH